MKVKLNAKTEKVGSACLLHLSDFAYLKPTLQIQLRVYIHPRCITNYDVFKKAP